MTMFAQRHRPILYALGVVGAIWVLAGGGYFYFNSRKPTAEKLAQHLHTTDLNRLSGQARADALRELARQMNGLSAEERRRARLAGEWDQWFAAMTEAEKGAFIEATLPSGFKQMLQSFEQLPEEKRKRAIENTLKELHRLRETVETENPELARSWSGRTNRPALSPELQQKVVKLGLKSFYGESSAQTKAELAPVIEEMQRTMESGRLFRGGR